MSYNVLHYQDAFSVWSYMKNAYPALKYSSLKTGCGSFHQPSSLKYGIVFSCTNQSTELRIKLPNRKYNEKKVKNTLLPPPASSSPFCCSCADLIATLNDGYLRKCVLNPIYMGLNDWGFL